MNEDANGKLIRELKEEITRLRDLLKAEGIEVEEGKKNIYFNQKFNFMCQHKRAHLSLNFHSLAYHKVAKSRACYYYKNGLVLVW